MRQFPYLSAVATAWLVLSDPTCALTKDDASVSGMASGTTSSNGRSTGTARNRHVPTPSVARNLVQPPGTPAPSPGTLSPRPTTLDEYYETTSPYPTLTMYPTPEGSAEAPAGQLPSSSLNDLPIVPSTPFSPTVPSSPTNGTNPAPVTPPANQFPLNESSTLVPVPVPVPVPEPAPASPPALPQPTNGTVPEPAPPTPQYPSYGQPTTPAPVAATPQSPSYATPTSPAPVATPPSYPSYGNPATPYPVPATTPQSPSYPTYRTPTTPAPVLQPSYPSWPGFMFTPEPVAVYVPPTDDFIKDQVDEETLKEEWEQKSNIEKAEAEWDEIRHDKNVKIVSIVFGITGFFLLLFVAHQLIENPDGFFGKICRCLLACVRILCWPLRMLCCRGARARDRRTHQLVQNEPGTYGYSHDLELT